MTSFITTSSALRYVSATALRSASTSTLRSSRRCMSSSSMMHDNDPVTIEIEKRRTLSKEHHSKTSPPHIDAPGWNEHLASNSEASVKASAIPPSLSSPATPSELQAETVDYVKARYSDDRMGPTNAFYIRDEVSGPLGTAAGREDTQEVYQTVVKKTTEKTTLVEEDVTPPKGRI
ncbi:hypothetical protein FPV67DRAFT_1651159 [Lyophyllum atratum]|nr:hypothetical protein FPV67DRAFT_1651159 [Lyophyllum atratum]